MTEENASLKMAIEAIRADERDSAWAKGYAACREAQRTELEWQRAEIERLRGELSYLQDEVIPALKAEIEQCGDSAHRFHEQQGKNHADTK